jgi:hypothetical protein
MIVIDVKDKEGNDLSIPINAISYLKACNGKAKSYYAIVKGDSLQLDKKGFEELKAYMKREKEYEYPKYPKAKRLRE